MVNYKLLEHCLLQASSKDVVTQCCHLAMECLGKSSDECTDACNKIVTLLELDSDVVGGKLLTNLCNFINLVLSQGNCDAQYMREYLFPDSFHSNLADLLIKIFVKNFSTWKTHVLDRQVSVATKIRDIEWHITEDGGLPVPPTCVVQMKTCKDNVNIEMNKETLATMVDSLKKIRQQITSVVQ